MDDSETDMNKLASLMTKLMEEEPNLDTDELLRRIQQISLDSTFTVSQVKALYDQVRNSAGGFSYKVDDVTQLKRYIILGSETGTYYINPDELQKLNIKSVVRLIQSRQGKKVLDLIEEYSKAGRCAKEDPLLFVLAKCATFSLEDEDKDADNNLTIEQRQEMYLKLNQDAYNRVSKICNIPTKLFLFNSICQNMISCHPPKKQAPSRKKTSDATSTIVFNQHKRKAADVVIEEPPTPPKKTKKDEFKRSAGWGRMRRRGMSKFYTDPNKDANKLLFHLTKYKSRHNWSHKQVLGYAHPKIPVTDPQKKAKDLVLTFVTRPFERFQKFAESIEGPDKITEDVINNINVIKIVSELSPKKEGSEAKLLEIYRQYGTREFDDPVHVSSFRLGFEHIPNGFLRCRKLWEMMLEDMPMMNMIRNLGTMTSCKVFDDPSNVDKVVKKLSNRQLLAKAKIHPMKILIALRAYENGSGKAQETSRIKERNKKYKKGKKKKDGGNDIDVEDEEGNNTKTWQPNAKITEALDKAFYDSFKQPDVGVTYKTGKKFMLALDVSGSMTCGGCVGCADITPAIASCALALMTMHIEDSCEIVAFGSNLVDIKANGLIRKNMSISDAVKSTGSLNFGGTDCAKPMLHALDNRITDIDVFIVYTDSETFAGNIHPSAAIRKYRKETPMKNARLIVMGMQSNGFTIADPMDAGMLDVVGFDAAVPDVIKQFVMGELDPLNT